MFDNITIILILVLIYVLYYFNYITISITNESFRGGGGGSFGGKGGEGGFHSGIGGSLGNMGSSYSSNSQPEDNNYGRGPDISGSNTQNNQYRDSKYITVDGQESSYANTYKINNNISKNLNNKDNNNSIKNNENNKNNENKLLPFTNGNSFENASKTSKSVEPDINITDNKVDNSKDFNEIVKNQVTNTNKLDGDDNSNVKYYYNDYINQSNINENAFDLVNQIDGIDYSNVKTGLEKCEEECDGVCFELGYMGNATCYPKEVRTFDYGSIYKNPTFNR